MSVKLEDFLYPSPASLSNHEEGELFEYAVILVDTNEIRHKGSLAICLSHSKIFHQRGKRKV